MGPRQRIIVLSYVILYFPRCDRSFKLGFRWYLQYLGETSWTAVSRGSIFGVSGTGSAADYLSGVTHFVLYELNLFIWHYF